MTLKLALWISGILGGIALAAPQLVVVGLFLIVPGFVLMLAPTVFIYLATFAVTRLLLPMAPGPGVNMAAAALTAILGWAVVQPAALAGKAAFARADLPDVIPDAPVPLRGNIHLETGDVTVTRTKPATIECTALCAALLDTPGVESVTISSSKRDVQVAPITFRLVQKASTTQATLSPVKPEAILALLPKVSAPAPPRNFKAEHALREERSAAVAAAWAVRLATRESLIADAAAPPADMTIRVTKDRSTRSAPTISRVEILDQGLKPLFRRSVVAMRVLAAPLHFSGQGGLETFRMTLGHRTLRRGADYPEMVAGTELFSHSSLARPTTDSSLRSDMLRLLDMALADPRRDATDPAFGLASIWFSSTSWRDSLPAQEVALLARAIADPRVPITRSLYDGYAKKVAPALRAALGARIVHPESPEQARTQLATLLSNMPAGTFATLSADERTMIGNGALRRQSYPMVTRLADRGAAAVPDLLAILESDAEIQPWSNKMSILRALQKAFLILGPKAGSALPVVQRLVLQQRSPILNSSGDRDDWYLALVRMGASIDDLDFSKTSPEMAARDREQLLKRVAKYNAENDQL